MSSPLLKSDDFKNNKFFLRMGSFGTVYRIQVNENGRNNTYAVKEYNLKKLETPGMRSTALREIKEEYRHLKLNMNNIIKSHGSFYDNKEETFKFSIDYHEDNLINYLEKNGALPLDRFIPFLRDIVSGK